MKKILFLPLLKMQSGHHQVAEALMDIINKETNDIILKKVDLLSYTNESFEKMVTGSYLKWIRFAPESYNLVYQKFFYGQPSREPSYKWFQAIFLKKMEQLLLEFRPDLIICTHGFPSHLLSQLKMSGKCHTPIINVYTDFFVNRFWGKEGIDFHFVPSMQIKDKLIREEKIPPYKVLVTGIPVHEEITRNSPQSLHFNRLKVLISGGSSGLGGIQKLAAYLKSSVGVDYLVLCGKNEHLYKEIESWNLNHIIALPYLSSRSAMNKIYDKVDAIVTKPGGVTVSEALRKRLPIFVHSALPGQEEINLQYLKKQGLISLLSTKKSMEDQISSVLRNPKKMDRLNHAIDTYHDGIEIHDGKNMVDFIEWILYQKQTWKLERTLSRDWVRGYMSEIW